MKEERFVERIKLEAIIDTKIDISNNQKWINLFEIFTLICLGFTALTVLAIFFQEDLFRIFTPFLAPFILIFMFLSYVGLTFLSILYIPFQAKKILWRVLVPISINLITFSIVYYLYDEIGDLRIETKFYINENRFNGAKDWVEQSIQPSTNEDYWRITLPSKYKSLAEDGKVSVKYEYGVVIIQFYRGGGLFEYGPSFIYRSDNIAPPFESFAETVCVKRLSPNWYDCY